jgi:hypothetical protein
MRKILSKEEEAKKTKRNQFLIGGVLILVMVASTIGYAFTRDQTNTTANSDKIIYNGLEFTKQTGYWNVNAGSYQFSFKYNPNETAQIASVLNPLGNYDSKPLYVNSDNIEATTELYRNLFYQNQIVERFQNACISGENCSDNAPVKNCSDNLIIIKESNSTEIKQQQSCVFINGNMGNLTELTDSFLFKITGIQ